MANGYHTGIYQWLLYWLTAASMKIFGVNEFAARFPTVIFGILTIGAVYLLGKELFGKKPALLAAFFIAFLKIEILWSRQVRPYQALQFFYLLGAYFVLQITNKSQKKITNRNMRLRREICSLRKRNILYGSKAKTIKSQISNSKLQNPKKLRKQEIKNWIGFLGCGGLASLFHGLGLVIFFNGFLYLLVTNLKFLKRKWLRVAPIALLFLGFGYAFKIQLVSVFSQIGKVNNLFYYRVFLTHNYLPLTFLAGLGGLFLLKKRAYKKLLLLIIFLGGQMFIASFLLGQPFIRYLYPVFPFIILLATYGFFAGVKMIGEIRGIREIGKRKTRLVITVLALTGLIFSLRNKLSLLPTPIYSLNEDMQEIPEVDWQKIYKLVSLKLKKNPKAILITNWNDLPIWYLGEGRLDYLVRTNNGKSDPVSGAMIIHYDNFVNLINEKPKGLVVLDSWDDRVPDGVREYCRDNLKKELEVDRLYQKQPRYWPVNVYSWGID